MGNNSAMLLIDNKKQVPKEFDKIAIRYDFATGMSQGYQGDLNYSAGFLELKGDEKVLDICCGTGRSVTALLPHLTTGTIVGLDNSEVMLEVAHRKFKDQVSNGKVEFVLRDAMEMNFPEHSFDAVFIAYGLRNMPDYDGFLKGVYHALKPGGTVVLHDYSLSHTWYAKIYWTLIAYPFMIPIGLLTTGQLRIFVYLYKSVMRFLRPRQVLQRMTATGFESAEYFPQRFWRAPILKIFRARKPV